MKPRRISRAQARAWLLSQSGLCWDFEGGPADLLRRLRCIQLDPLDRIGPNAELVAMARLPTLRREAFYGALYPGNAFEHFAKERCLLPADAFPAYRDQAAETPWWRANQRMKRLPSEALTEVLAEVQARGPVTSGQLTERGRVDPIDWSGWKGTSSATKMALELLWLRCEVVVCGRAPAKVYDLPSRALPEVCDGEAPPDFGEWALLERVEAAGLVPTATGPWWSMLTSRRVELTQRLTASGAVELVEVEGARRRYLAPAGFLERPLDEPDERMRILGPLDPFLWARNLIGHVFDFDYVWEVYKPAAKRRWGYYVCPLLHRGRLVGRFEGRLRGDTIEVQGLWPEEGFDQRAFEEALHDHGARAQR